MRMLIYTLSVCLVIYSKKAERKNINWFLQPIRITHTTLLLSNKDNTTYLQNTLIFNMRVVINKNPRIINKKQR